MITGRLQEKKNRYYMILNIRDENGRHKAKWIATGLTVHGNKRRAEAMLRSAINEYEERVALPLPTEEQNPLLPTI